MWFFVYRLVRSVSSVVYSLGGISVLCAVSMTTRTRVSSTVTSVGYAGTCTLKKIASFLCKNNLYHCGTNLVVYVLTHRIRECPLHHVHTYPPHMPTPLHLSPSPLPTRTRRVGGQDNFFHCDNCGFCLSLAMRDGHTCRRQMSKDNCPVCMEVLS